MVDKCILVSAIMRARASPICTLVEDKIFTIFSRPFYYRYMPTMETYPQKASFRSLILDTRKSWKPWNLKVWQISKIAF
jgi:hypothetical protein